MSINAILIRQRLVYINQAVEQLRRLSHVPIEQFAGSDASAAAESYLRRALEAVFDVGRHILAKSGAVELAQEYKSIARGLHEKGVISSDLCDTLTQMAGYRNRLVHLYNLISDQEIHAIINQNLPDIHQFTAQVNQFLTKQ